MRHFTINEKARGELAVRSLSDKAQKFYNGTEPFAVYEYDVDGEKRYAYDGMGYDDNLTLEELDRALCDMAVVEIDTFRTMDVEDMIEYLDNLDNWSDADPEYYECLCDELGLDYHSYDDPDTMWADILEKAGE